MLYALSSLGHVRVFSSSYLKSRPFNCETSLNKSSWAVDRVLSSHITMEEHSKHLRLLALLNSEYVKKNTESNEDLLAGDEKVFYVRQPKETTSNQNKAKEIAVKKFKKLVKNQGIASVEEVQPSPSFEFESEVTNKFQPRGAGNNEGLKKRKKEQQTAVVSVEPSTKDAEGNIFEGTKTKFRHEISGEGKTCFDGGFCWCEPPEESLAVEFCRDTSLHGLKYIGQSKRHLTERIFWFVTFTLGLCVAVFMIREAWIKNKSNPIIVSFKAVETNVDQIPFPAVTICNMNKMLKSKATEYLGPLGKPDDAYYVRHICSATKSFSKKFNFTDENEAKFRLEVDDDASPTQKRDWTHAYTFLKKASQSCDDMIPLCTWQDTFVSNCSKLFRHFGTEYGMCCTFNLAPTPLLFTDTKEEEYEKNEIKQWKEWDIHNDGFLLQKNYKYDFPRRQMRAGKPYGLSVVLNPELDEYFCTSSDSYGFRMSTNLNIDSDRVDDFGISIRPNSELFVNVKPEISLSDQSVLELSQEARKCYNVREYRLKYYGYYTKSNCIEECIANKTLKDCGCKRYYMPRHKGESLCGSNFNGTNCVEAVEKSINSGGLADTCKMCLPSCFEIRYTSKATATTLRPNIWNNYLNGNTSLATLIPNASIVHVFLGEESHYPRVRQHLFGITELLASTGGLMGLCLGFSGLSLMEVIYFLTLRAWWCFKRKKNENKSKNKRADEPGAKIHQDQDSSSNTSASQGTPVQAHNYLRGEGTIREVDLNDCIVVNVAALSNNKAIVGGKDHSSLPKATTAKTASNELPKVSIDIDE